MRTLSSITQSFMGKLKNSNPNLLEQNKISEHSNLNKDRQNSTQVQEGMEFIHPILIKQDFRESIANYNRHIKKYNIEVWKANAEIRDYNREVIRFRKDNPPTDEQQANEFLWKKKRQDIAPDKYNELAEKYNAKHKGLWMRKINLKEEVKPSSEKVFIALLFELNAQLFKRKNMRENLGVHVPSSIPALKIYPNVVVERKRDGEYENLPISKTSFRHHRERLEEAGVLLDYVFKGTRRPVEMRINEEIMVVTDNKRHKNPTAENQPLTSLSSNKVAHSNVSSRKLLDKNKIRDKGVLPTTSKTESGQNLLNCTEKENTGTPTSQGPKKPVRPLTEKSRKILREIDSAENFAKNLSAGRYNNYRPMNMEEMEHEAMYGSMSQDDFMEIAIQDVFASAAELWKNKEVYPGSWVNAIKIWRNEVFITPNGYILSKPNILQRWKTYLDILAAVKKYSLKYPDWDIRFPSLYFDPVRKTKVDGCFAYAARRFRIEPKETKTKQQRKIESLRTTRKQTDLKKAQDKIKLYLKNKISLDDLYYYVENNCNQTVYNDINNIIKREFKKYQ